MPEKVMFALVIEAALITLTSMLLTQPSFLFRSNPSERLRLSATFGGMLMLCVTFVWSVIFGCVLVLFDMANSL
jgi:hypothetical protein